MLDLRQQGPTLVAPRTLWAGAPLSDSLELAYAIPDTGTRCCNGHVRLMLGLAFQGVTER